ncbi:MAG: hypothetical protein D5R97_04815 [Candidatus Syntrophonatronum acetioxidans]|uniref:Uncharacterized protein n=1 Tax=Candidatus Syntrophonatronum acetioxidans TaxID=1795816 RepID=A0A424YEP2_9FIRM|nr:MAG: hypothetical protein D5R97_04815 [Candidatus Syntrophonatronum acetioxidans]
MKNKIQNLECDICGKVMKEEKFFIEEAFLKGEEGERKRYHIRMIPLAVCINCKEKESIKK